MERTDQWGRSMQPVVASGQGGIIRTADVKDEAPSMASKLGGQHLVDR